MDAALFEGPGCENGPSANEKKLQIFDFYNLGHALHQSENHFWLHTRSAAS
jgi:hypothetical protein